MPESFCKRIGVESFEWVPKLDSSVPTHSVTLRFYRLFEYDCGFIKLLQNLNYQFCIHKIPMNM